MKKRVKIDLSWRAWSLILGFFILIGFIGLNFAYNSEVSPSVFGHTIDEIEVINPDGSTTSLEQYIEDKISGIKGYSCDSTPIYNSMTLTDSRGNTGINYYDDKYKHSNGIKPVPASCKTDAGCTIKQEIFDSKGLKLTRQYQYIQYSSNKWWSSYTTAGAYLNGDTTSTNIIPTYGGDYALYLRDDYQHTTSTVEISSDNWTFIDRTSAYGMKVYICSENTDTV